MTRVLLAPDKFKGSLSAVEVVEALAEALTEAVPGVELDRCPIADGGDGTVDAALAAGYRAVDATVSGPTGAPVAARYAERDGTAVVELALASGLCRLPGGVPAPLTASSRGTGELVAAALDAGASTVVIGIGGSACTDGGAGLVTALGARLLDATGAPLPDGGAALRDLHRLDLTRLHPRLRTAEVVVACDVRNPLLGPDGAAAVYGPQKGADPADVAALESALARWAEVVAATVGVDRSTDDGAGAAGGVGFAALALLDARMARGIEIVLDLCGFAERLPRADLVVTGEGSLDAQTLQGKGPAGVARAAAGAGCPAVAVAGRVTLGADELRRTGLAKAYALTDLEPDPDRSVRDARRLLGQVAARLAEDWLRPP